MEIHKPKPWHNLGELLQEVGVIVIGVLIALAAEQIADGLHWRHKIHEAEHAMRLELVEDDGPQVWARLAAVRCFDGQLDALQALASTQTDRRAFRKAALAYTPPSRSWDSTSWQAVVASDVGTHMGAEELVRWSSPYRTVPLMQQTADAEQRARTALAALRDKEGALSDVEADRVIGVIAELRAENIAMAGGGLVLLQAMHQTGLELGREVRDDVLKQARKTLGDCATDPAPILTGRGPLAISDGHQFDHQGTIRRLFGLPPLD